VLSGSTLYGTTYYGGSSDKGTVYKVNTDGTGYTVLKHFSYSDVAHPYAGLVLSAARSTGQRGRAAVRINGRCTR